MGANEIYLTEGIRFSWVKFTLQIIIFLFVVLFDGLDQVFHMVRGVHGSTSSSRDHLIQFNGQVLTELTEWEYEGEIASGLPLELFVVELCYLLPAQIYLWLRLTRPSFRLLQLVLSFAIVRLISELRVAVSIAYFLDGVQT